MLCTSLLLGVHFATFHFRKDDDSLQDFNPGVSLICDSLSGGFYKNSDGKLSLLFTKSFPLIPQVSLVLGLVSGYQEAPIVPAIALSFQPLENVRLSLFPGTRYSSGGIHLSFQWSLK